MLLTLLKLDGAGLTHALQLSRWFKKIRATRRIKVLDALIEGEGCVWLFAAVLRTHTAHTLICIISLHGF